MSTTRLHGISSASLKDVECYQLGSDSIEDYWERVEPFIEKWIAASHGELNAKDVYNLVLQGYMHIFCVHAAGDIKLAVITEFIQYPQMKVLRIAGIAGEKPLLAFKFQPALEAWAVANGAIALETFATPETVKLDEKIGMKPLYTLMRKPLYALH